MTELKKPKVSNSAQQELDKAEAQFDKFDQEVKSMTLDRMNMAPKQEIEPQTKIAQSDLDKMKDIYIKPSRAIMSREKFNEKFRDDYDFAKQYVHITAENIEIKGDTLEFWTKPFPGVPAEYWQIPANKPVWAPRYAAEQLKRCNYHRLVMQDRPSGGDGMGQYYGTMSVDTTVQRLDAHPVSKKRSVFMGSNNF